MAGSMIPFFDKFIDTREKRYHLLLILFLSSAILLILPYIFLGVQLSFLDTYDSLYELLEKPYIEWTFISRMISDFISIPTINLANIVECLIENVSPVEVILSVLLIASYGILESKKSTTICLSILVVEVLLCFALAYISLYAGSLLVVISNIKWIGNILLLSNIVLCGFVLFHLLRQLKYYSRALPYTVVEIKEHADN